MGRTIISSTLPGAPTKEKHLADAQFRMLRENDGIYMVRVIYKDSRDRAEAMDPHSWLTVIFAVPPALES